MIPLAYGLVGAVLVLVAAGAMRMVRATPIDDLLDEPGAAAADAPRTGLTIRVVDWLGAATHRVLHGIYGSSRVSWLSDRLRAAGQPDGLTPTLFIQREAGFITLGLVIFLLAWINSQLFLGVVLFLLFAGWMQAWLFFTVRNRAERIERDLPEFLDVLAVTVAAGLPFRTAMERVSEYHSGPLAEELRTTLREMQLGVARRRALERMRERNRSQHVAVFVTAMLQAEELGTPLAEALQNIASDVRRERAHQVRQAATKAQPKVSVVVTLLIIPGVIILILGGMIVMNLDKLQGLLNG